MRVVCLVPSWTETLIEAGVDVIGRTRFCIHPDWAVKNIAVVGGTKNIDIEKIILLKSDLIILDKQENTLDIVQQLDSYGLKWMATQVTSIETCILELEKMADVLKNKKLLEYADLYKQVRNSKKLTYKLSKENTKNISYVIWKNPWMCVSAETFIGDTMSCFGYKLEMNVKKYFEISEEELLQRYCLFSTEPYPFEKNIEKIKSCGFSGELIDGEKISWFGIRNLKFMLSCLNIQK